MASHSEHDILRTANLWLLRHGEAAVVEARSVVSRFREAGDLDGSDLWLRVIVAIERLAAPAIGMR